MKFIFEGCFSYASYIVLANSPCVWSLSTAKNILKRAGLYEKLYVLNERRPLPGGPLNAG